MPRVSCSFVGESDGEYDGEVDGSHCHKLSLLRSVFPVHLLVNPMVNMVAKLMALIVINSACYAPCFLFI